MWEGCELEKEEHIFCFTLSQDAFVATQRLCHVSKEEYLRYVARHFTRYQRETKDKLVQVDANEDQERAHLILKDDNMYELPPSCYNDLK